MNIMTQAREPFGLDGVVLGRLMSASHRRFYVSALESLGALRGSRVLDAGCGVASHVDLFDDRGLSYIGIDRSHDAILASTFDHPHRAFLCGDLAKMVLPRIRGAVMVNVMLWLDDPVETLCNLRNALMPGTALVAGCPVEWNNDPSKVFRAAAFRDIAECKIALPECDYLITRGVA